MNYKYQIILLLLFISGSSIAQVSDPRIDRSTKRLIFDSQEHLKAFIEPFAADDADEDIFDQKITSLESKGFQSLLNISELEAALENGTATVPDGADIEEDLYIGDDFFGALLNKSREIVIGGELFKYDRNGAYITSQLDADLDALIDAADTADIDLDALPSEMINNNKVYRLSNQLKFFPFDYENSIQYEENYDVGNPNVSEPAPATADSFGPSYNLKQCTVDDSGVFESLLPGSSETCISRIDSKKRIKTKFSNQNYIVYSSTYIKVKSQKWKRIIFGTGYWYKSDFCDYLELGRTIVMKYPVEFPSPPNFNHNFLIKDNTYNRVIDQYGQTVRTTPLGTTNIFEQFPFDDASFNYEIYYYLGTYNPTSRDINKMVGDGIKSLVKSLGTSYDKLFEKDSQVKVGMTIDTPNGVIMAEYGRKTRKYRVKVIRKTYDWNVHIKFKSSAEDFFGGLIKDVGFNTFTNAKTYDVTLLNFYGIGKYGGNIYGSRIIKGDINDTSPSQIDTDGDGVPDINDLCKFQRGTKQFNGCPFATIQDQALYTNRINAQGSVLDEDADSERKVKTFGACFNMDLKTSDYPFANRRISGSYKKEFDIIAGNQILMKGASDLVIKPSSSTTAINLRILETPCSFRTNGARKIEQDPIAQINIDIQSLDNIQKIQLYPNPTGGKFFLNLGSPVSTAVVKVHTLDGKQVYTEQFSNKDKMELDLTGHKKGIYFVSILTDGKTFSSKIIKK